MKRLLAILLALCLLTGCQLASEEKQDSELNDRLVGVFVTFEDLGGEFDLEGWFEDHPEALRGGEIALDAAQSMEYTERIPVTLGEDCWLVPGFEGLSMGQYWNGEYWTGFTTEGFCEVKTHVAGGEGSDAIQEEGTIYVPMDSEVMLYANPVYGTPEGEYYTIPTMGMHSTVSTGGMSQSVSDEKTWTVEGEEKTYSAQFTAAVQGVSLAETVRFIWMSGEHEELGRENFVPGALPEAVTPHGDAAYLIVEEIAGEEVTRTLYQSGDDPVKVFYQSQKLWCLPDYAEVKWNE